MVISEQVYVVDHGIMFATVMELIKGDFSACVALEVPARHEDIPNAYVKADKEEHLDIYLATRRG